MGLAVSPNGGSARERQRLVDRFGDRLTVNPELTRKAVSYQGNRRVPGLRWLKYKEGFSRTLVEHMLEDFRPASVLDPFAGIGTTPLIAASRGMRATGVEIMPVGVLAAKAIAEAANGVSKRELESEGARLLDAVTSRQDTPSEHTFPHVRITQAAFPPETESAIARVREFLSTVDNDSIRTMLNFACMSVLEAVSYTRKDGQYLRWDYRSGRALRARVNKGPILSLAQALGERLFEMLQDMGPLKQEFGGASPEFLTGSSLELLRGLPDASFDMVMTSPPYANRYDYTRTYALELAWLGYDNDDFATLRQRLLSATVENKSKLEWLRQTYGRDSRVLENAIEMYQGQAAVREVLDILREHVQELGNRHVIRLIEGYFLEMSLIVAELGRIARPGGTVVMVNDNVQYHGEEVPVDLILSDFAEQSGFKCKKIWTLQRGKGNSSQQMSKFGRRELRKCVYLWERLGA